MAELKSIGVNAAQSALNNGAKVDRLPESFYSGGRVYTHVLHTTAGRSFRIARSTFCALRFSGRPCAPCTPDNCPGCNGRFIGMGSPPSTQATEPGDEGGMGGALTDEERADCGLLSELFGDDDPTPTPPSPGAAKQIGGA